MEDGVKTTGFETQKESPYNKYLPYAEGLEEESCRQLSDIKANLARAVQLRDLKIGSSHWVGQLSKYIRMHGMKFSKEDHLTFIHLLFEMATIPDLELSLVVKYSQMLLTLLKKRVLLTREELELPWKPLYQLVESVLYSPYEPHGLRLFPHVVIGRSRFRNIDSIMKSLVTVCRVYFSVEASQEMLDEWRPLLCPFDITMSKGITYFDMFLPTTLPPEQHDKGFKLWFDEVLGLWDSVHNAPSWEVNILNLFARLAHDNIGYIDWEPWLPKIFTRFLRSLSVPVGSQKLIGRSNHLYNIQPTTWWITSMMGGSSSCQKHLSQLFKALESFYHPSNHGGWMLKLQRILSKMPENFARRLNRERHKKPTWENQIPASHKLTDENVTEFVLSIKPLLFMGMFSKLGSQDSAAGLQHVASMRPELIIPPLLERTYQALETLTEPHRLTSCLSCLVSVIRAMLQGGKWYPEGRTHVMPILNLCLPGIDSNDLRKSLMTFQLISTIVSLVPLVDCSEAVQVRSDLTEVEIEVCSSTAQFEDFLCQFMDRLFALVENCAHDHTHRQEGTTKLNQQESLLEVGLISTFSAVMSQCSASLFKVALKRLHRFVTGNVLEVSLAGRYTADLVRAAAKANPEPTCKLFVPHFCDRIKALADSEDIQKEEHLDDELMWNLKLLSEITRCDSKLLLPYKDDLITVLKCTLHLSSKSGSETAGLLLRHLLRSLTLIYTMDYRSVAGGWDKPLEEYLPIRDWGKPGDIDDLQVMWHVPSVEEKACATELLQTFLLPELEKNRRIVAGENSLTREELLRSLKIIEHCILGSGAELPVWEAEQVKLVDSLVELKRSKHLCTVGEPISINGKNVRELVVETMRPLLAHMLSSCEDDAKGLTQLVKVYDAIMFFYGCQKDDFDGRWKSLQIVKRAMENKCIGKKKHIRALLIDRIQLQHEMRSMNRNNKMFTTLHEQLFQDLLHLSVSRYSEVRKKAQHVLCNGFHTFAYSYRSQLKEVLSYLKDDPDIEHHQFKGALYVILAEGKKCLAIRRSLDVANMIWPAIVKAQHSEKPSILKLIDTITERIRKHIETTNIKIEASDECVVKAKLLANSAQPNPSLAPATEAEVKNGLEVEKKRNQQNLDTYNQLITTLVQLVEGGTLRWKFSQLAMELMGMQIRHDTPLPDCAVNLYVKNMVHETNRVRKICVNCVSAILKQQKRKHKTINIDPYKTAGVSPPSGKNQQQPGDREDNQWHHYQGHDLPDTKEKWEACVFVDKTHWGYYSWPKELKVYAPSCEQPKLGRTKEELGSGELPFYQYFSNQEFVDKLVAFLALEDQKGKDKFSSRNFTLFKGLFRNFDDAFVPLFRPHIERLVSDTNHDTHDSSQRCAAELISALIRGMKHWSFEKMMGVWEWLIPVIRTAVTNISPETVTDWGTCFATAAESRDPRKLFPLLELLMESPLGTDGGSFSDASRLYVLQGALAQQEWRVPSLLHRLLKYLMNYIRHPYKNVRDRLGSVLTNCFLYDFPQANGCPTRSPKVADFIEEVLPQLEVLRKIAELEKSNGNNAKVLEKASVENSKMEVVAPAEPAVEAMEVDKNGSNGEEGDEERKTALKLIKTMMKWLAGSLHRMLYSAPEEIFKFLPLVCLLESESQDPEIQSDCSLTLACMAQALIQPKVMATVLKTVKEVSHMGSWHARAAILGYAQVLVFNNLFNVQEAVFKQGIREVVMRLLCDDQLEVREMAAETLTGLIHCGYWEIDEDMVHQFEKLASTKLKKKKRSKEPILPELLIKRHAGVLGLGACVQAFPYEVPTFIPQILMDLSGHLDDPQPIQGGVKKMLSSFRHTHHDNWQDHKQRFTDDQLVVLTDVLVSPNYYA